MKQIALVALAALALSASPALAEEHLEIAADTTTYDGKAHTYQMQGHVRVTLPQLVVTCEKATVYADPGEKAIVKVVFTGGVEAQRGTDTFRASRITYMVDERRLVAEGATHTRLKLPKASGPLKGP